MGECGMDRDAPRGRLRRWAAIFAALIRAGGAWIRRALLRHRLSRRAASPAVNKEGRKDADGVCSKIRPPPRRNRDVGDIGKRRTSVGDIGERRTNVADIENLGAAQGPKKVLQAATSRAAAAAHSVHQLDSKNAEPLTRPTPAAPSATSRAAAAHSAHQLDSNNAETLARPVPAKPLPLARPAQAAPSKEVKDSTRHARVVNSKKLLARPAPAATRPVRRQKKVAAVPHQPHQTQWFEEKGGYGIDHLFAEEAGDPERVAHASYGKEAHKYKGFTLCLTCYLKGKVTKIRDHDEMKKHCRSAHQDEGTKCKKQGCIARGHDKREIGLHQDVCHKI